MPFCVAAITAFLIYAFVGSTGHVNASEWFKGRWLATFLASDVVVCFLMLGGELSMRINAVMWSLVVEALASVEFPLMFQWVERQPLVMLAARALLTLFGMLVLPKSFPAYSLAATVGSAFLFVAGIFMAQHADRSKRDLQDFRVPLISPTRENPVGIAGMVVGAILIVLTAAAALARKPQHAA